MKLPEYSFIHLSIIESIKFKAWNWNLNIEITTLKLGAKVWVKFNWARLEAIKPMEAE